MKVSELARRVGIAPSAIRFYEAEGLLPQPRRAASGYRDYGETDLCRLRVMVSLRALGLELREAGRLADMCSAGHCDEMADDLLPQLVIRRLEIAKARAELDHLDTQLTRLEEALRNGETQVSQVEGASCGSCDQDCCSGI
jgi:MerR family copper efflux transcriptional regulator